MFAIEQLACMHCHLQDLDTDAPTLNINSTSQHMSIQGTFEETVGSTLLLRHTTQALPGLTQQQPQPHAQEEGASPMDVDNGEGVSGRPQTLPPPAAALQHKHAVYAGLSEMKLVFRQPHKTGQTRTAGKTEKENEAGEKAADIAAAAAAAPADTAAGEHAAVDDAAGEEAAVDAAAGENTAVDAAAGENAASDAGPAVDVVQAP